VARRLLVSPFLTNDTNPSSFQGVQIVPEERTGNKGSSDHASGWSISNGNERKGEERKAMDLTTLLIVIVVLVLLFGGGGYYWRGRRR
jgi:hypothetical protein